MIITALALAAAQPAPVDAVTLDLRCLLLTSLLGSSEDAAVRQAGEKASLYYFGRVDAEVADRELEERLWQQSIEIRRMSEQDRQATMQACGTAMQQRGRRLVEVGNAVAVRESAAERSQ